MEDTNVLPGAMELQEDDQKGNLKIGDISRSEFKGAQIKCQVCGEQFSVPVNRSQTLVIMAHLLCEEHLCLDGFACSECPDFGSHKREKVASHVQHRHAGTKAHVVDRIVEEPLFDLLVQMTSRCFPEELMRIETYLKKKKVNSLKERKPRARKISPSKLNKTMELEAISDEPFQYKNLISGGIETFGKLKRPFPPVDESNDVSPSLEELLKQVEEQYKTKMNKLSASANVFKTESVDEKVLRLEAELVDERKAKKEMAEMLDFCGRLQGIEQLKNALLTEQNSMLTKCLLEKSGINYGDTIGQIDLHNQTL